MHEFAEGWRYFWRGMGQRSAPRAIGFLLGVVVFVGIAHVIDATVVTPIIEWWRGAATLSPADWRHAMEWEDVTVTPDGTLAYPDGSVRSCNPARLQAPYGPYTISRMPAGTKGPYELVKVDGGSVAYNPTGHETVVYGFKKTSPNTSCSAVTKEPL